MGILRLLLHAFHPAPLSDVPFFKRWLEGCPRLKLSTVSIALAATLLLPPATARADYTTTISPQTSWGVWEGWGVSLCWWANVFGNRDDLANLLFTMNYTAYDGGSRPGLGMNIARYNAGGCSPFPASGETMQLSPNIAPFRQMQGFWKDGTSSDPASASWNWTADANQRTALLKAKARGVNVFELFSNSPMWWMCLNRNPSGADVGSNDNLQPASYGQHAVYLATVAKYFQDHLGITFDTVEPFNEPRASWWQADGTQEGCHFNLATQATVIGLLRTELDARGLTSMRVAASDETSYDTARSTWQGFSAATKALVDRVNVHGYQYGGGRRDLLYSATLGKPLWNSEYGESDASGISLASNLNLDFRWLHPTAWCYWQPFDSGGWGLIQSNPGDNWIGPVNPKYYVLAQYTRHIRSGMTIIDGGEGNTVAAYSAAARKLVIVTMNYDTAQTITYDLSQFHQAAGPVQRWITQTGTGAKYQPTGGLAVSNKSFAVSFPINTVQTFEVANVDLEPPPRLDIEPGTIAGEIKLSWPVSAVGYRLYSAPNLNAPVPWTLVTNPPISTIGDRQVVFLPASGSRQLFRLSNP